MRSSDRRGVHRSVGWFGTQAGDWKAHSVERRGFSGCWSMGRSALGEEEGREGGNMRVGKKERVLE